MQKKGREVASCLFHNLSPFICTCSRCRFFMLEVAAKTASRYFFPKIARYRFCIRGLGVYELCLYPIKAFFDCEAPPGDVFWKIDKVFSYMRAARYRSCITMWTSRNLVLWGRPHVDGNGFKDGKVAFLLKKAQRVLRTRIDMVENSFSNNLSRSTVAGYLNYWLKVYCEPKLAPNTINGYRTNIEKHAAKCRACKNRLCHARTFFHRDYNGHIFARSDGYAGGLNK